METEECISGRAMVTTAGMAQESGARIGPGKVGDVVGSNRNREGVETVRVDAEDSVVQVLLEGFATLQAFEADSVSGCGKAVVAVYGDGGRGSARHNVRDLAAVEVKLGGFHDAGGPYSPGRNLTS